jgi:hypothetical protein
VTVDNFMIQIDISIYYTCVVYQINSHIVSTFTHSLNDDDDTITLNHNPMLSHTSQES